jgi:xanthine dehydrogenase accessory factor
MPMITWVNEAGRLLAAGESVVLVTVARAEGSTPREAGAKMLVAREQQWQTIGGGHLEWRAAEIARQMLEADCAYGARHIERLSLGPSLGQCCGGVATLAFEVLSPADLGWIGSLATCLHQGRACVRRVVLSPSGAAAPVMLDTSGKGGHRRDASSLGQKGDESEFTDIVAPQGFNIVLFGAGHVGQALVKILGTLPCTVTWVDERDAQFPAAWPSNVIVEATDAPEAFIDQAPPHSYFLVMTYSHALDQRLCQQIFQRDDFAYFGLIGSRTKRRKFEHRLRDRGIGPERLARMVCPIGIEGITGKAPEVIAVAVAAQLLRVRELEDQLESARGDSPAHAMAAAELLVR